MKTLLTQFATYHVWAGGLLADCILALEPQLPTQPVPSSFPSLHETLLHMWDAESIWWQRMKLQEQIVRPREQPTDDTRVVIKGLMEQSRQWAGWVQDAQPHMLEHAFIYYNSKREKFKQPVWQMLLHLFNHGTYHRGQIVTMLRQLGITTIPQTDFIVWSRMRGVKEK